MTNKVSKHYFLDKTITFDDDTNERIEGMFNELTEEKYEIEATNISSIKKADLETELDRSFVNQLVCYMKFDKLQASRFLKLQKRMFRIQFMYFFSDFFNHSRET